MNPNCTTPWMQGYFGETNYDDTNPCTLSQSRKMQRDMYQFLLDHFISNNVCPSKIILLILRINRQRKNLNFFRQTAPCHRVTYKRNPQYYDIYSGLIHVANIDINDEKKVVYLFVENTDVEVSRQVPVMTFWGFVSSCGGSMGLFLGFSFLSTLFDLYSWMEKRSAQTVSNTGPLASEK